MDVQPQRGWAAQGAAARRALFRGNEVAELRAAIEWRAAPVHDGAWGRATMEACLAIARSAAQRRENRLVRQVPAPKGA